MNQERLVGFVLLLVFYGFLFLFFFHFKLFLFLISISVSINDFEILASSSSEIITKSLKFSSFGWPIFIVVGSGFLDESNSSSSIKKSSVFGTTFGVMSGGVGWIIGCFII